MLYILYSILERSHIQNIGPSFCVLGCDIAFGPWAISHPQTQTSGPIFCIYDLLVYYIMYTYMYIYNYILSFCDSICETLGIKRAWSSEQIHEYLLSGFTKEKEEFLLGVRINKALYKYNEICSFALQLLSHTDKTKEKILSSNSLREETKEKEEVLNAESNGVFFLDNEGENVASVTKVKNEFCC